MKMKKVLSLIVIVLIASNAIYADEKVYYGDVNNDGCVDAADVAALVDILNGNTSANYNLTLANVDKTGDIDTADLELLIDYVLGRKDLVEYVAFDGIIYVNYSGTTAIVSNLPSDGTITATVSGADVTINNTLIDQEITTVLSGESSSGSYTYNGEYKTTTTLNGLTLKGSADCAINIKNGKRNALILNSGTTNILEDASTDGGQKAALYTKGHLEISGDGTLEVKGNVKHAISAKEYIQLKKTTGTINITSAASDGIHAGQYFLMNGGTVTISGVSGDGIQAEACGDTDYDEDEADGSMTIGGGTLNITLTGDDAAALQSDSDLTVKGSATQITIVTEGDADKGIKCGRIATIKNGTTNITQSGSYIATTVDNVIDDSYTTAIKADEDIAIMGGSVTIDNSADGGKGLSADGNITIDESNATVTLDITANGAGGILDASSSSSAETTKSYRVYVALPTTGGSGSMGPGGNTSNYWTTLYLYNSEGTQVATLTNTVSLTSGSTTKTFYYYDFGASDSGNYYFKSADYTSRGGGNRGSSSGTTYNIVSSTFSGPTSGVDYYYEISNSYSTSGSTRTFTLSNVTNTWNGSTSDSSEDSGESYNASGIKADGNVTVSSGTIIVKNSGEMSKSIKSKGTVIIDGGTLTLSPSGSMKVISSDASYSTGVKAVDFIQNDGTLTIKATGSASRGVSATNVTTNGGSLDITNSGTGVAGTNDSYTAKGIKADTDIALNAGTISVTMSGNGGKGIKSSGTYSQGTSDGEGPTLTVTTTGSSFTDSSSSSQGQMGMGMPGGQTSTSGSSAKAIKIQGDATLYGGTTEVSTSSDGAEGLESKTSINIEGGKHYFQCYDDCINCSGKIYFNGGVTVCYGFGNDAVDSNAGTTGAITIGDGTVFAYSTKGSPEEGLDCDDNSYIVINGTGTAISAGAAQGGGGGMGGSSSSSIGSASQGYYLSTSSISYKTSTYYTLADASGNNLVTYSFAGACSSSLGLFTASGMTKGSSYTVKSSTNAPTDATTSWHGLYLGSTASGTSSVTSFTAQ